MRLRRTTSPPSPDAGTPTLIGVEDLTTPWWAKVGEDLAGSSAGRMLRAAPVALGILVRLAWQTSPRLTMLAAVVQLVSGCATAFGLLATANVFTSSWTTAVSPSRAPTRS
ncbi:MAG TPA: hypothetical protein VE155_05075 [Pseudonocardiaceae bacterium]|nr:hypothetical protein [Pseudonocardiaceae bacterium]